MDKIDQEAMHKMLCNVRNFKYLTQEHKDMLYKVCTVLIDTGILDEGFINSVATIIVDRLFEGS